MAEAEAFEAGLTPRLESAMPRIPDAAVDKDEQAACRKMTQEAKDVIAELDRLSSMRPRTPKRILERFTWQRRLLESQCFLPLGAKERKAAAEEHLATVQALQRALEARAQIDVSTAMLQLGKYAVAEAEYLVASVDVPQDGRPLTEAQRQALEKMLGGAAGIKEALISLENIQPRTPELMEGQWDATLRQMQIQMVLVKPEDRRKLVETYEQYLEGAAQDLQKRVGIDATGTSLTGLAFARAQAAFIKASLTLPAPPSRLERP